VFGEQLAQYGRTRTRQSRDTDKARRHAEIPGDARP
jgi:hypothetical protein